MQSDVRLQDPFSYSYLGVILLILLIVILLLFLVIKLIKRVNSNKPVASNIKVVDINTIKNSYLLQITKLEENVKNNKISERKAYNTLSSIIRRFIFDTTNVDVMKYSLSEIKKLKIKNLPELIEEYYEPEFSREGNGDILSSIQKTKEVIIKWK